MAKRNRTRDYAAYVAFRIAVCVVQALTWNGALAMARFGGWLVYRFDRRHRLVAIANVKFAYPEYDDADADRMVRASYEHLGIMMIEMIRMPRLLHKNTLDNYARHYREGELQIIRDVVATGRPPITLTGHFGNWEILGYVSGLLGFRAAVVARRLDNPHLDRYVAKLRRHTGLGLLDKTRDYDQILATIARGDGLGFVGDQDAGRRGIYVDFFGQPASTYKSIALISIEFNAPILVMGAARVGSPMKYVVYLEDVIWPEDYIHRPDAVKAMTQRFTSSLEQMVRRHPEQYFWLHRRWKTQQPARALKIAA